MKLFKWPVYKKPSSGVEHQTWRCCSMCSTLFYVGISQHFSNKQKLEPTSGKFLQMRTYRKFDDSQVAIYVSCLKRMSHMECTLYFYLCPIIHGNPLCPCHPKIILRGETWSAFYIVLEQPISSVACPVLLRDIIVNPLPWNKIVSVWCKGPVAMAPHETILEVVKMQELFAFVTQCFH